MILFATPARRADRPTSGWYQRTTDVWTANRNRARALCQRRSEFASTSDQSFRDLGMTRGEVTGTPLWRPNLPLFMQAGFGAGRNG